MVLADELEEWLILVSLVINFEMFVAVSSRIKYISRILQLLDLGSTFQLIWTSFK